MHIHRMLERLHSVHAHRTPFLWNICMSFLEWVHFLILLFKNEKNSPEPLLIPSLKKLIKSQVFARCAYIATLYIKIQIKPNYINEILIELKLYLQNSNQMYKNYFVGGNNF